MNDQGGKREHQGRETSWVGCELNNLGLVRSAEDELWMRYGLYRVEGGYQRQDQGPAIDDAEGGWSGRRYGRMGYQPCRG